MPSVLPACDAFGDRFDLARLPLPRPAAGYGVQCLDTDLLLDASGDLLPVRTAGLRPFFPAWEAAHAAASRWMAANHEWQPEVSLAIVPLGYDADLDRPILIYGVLCNAP